MEKVEIQETEIEMCTYKCKSIEMCTCSFQLEDIVYSYVSFVW